METSDGTDKWFDGIIFRSGTGLPGLEDSEPGGCIWVRRPRDAGMTTLIFIPPDVAEQSGYAPRDFLTGRRMAVQVESPGKVNRVHLGELPDGFDVVRANIAALLHFISEMIGRTLDSAFDPVPKSCKSGKIN